MLKRTLVFSNAVPIEDVGVVVLENQIFRKELQKDGFTMHQYSVYIRYCGSLESANVHIKRVKSLVPDEGHVSILTITDKQYSGIENIWGSIAKKSKPAPLQLEFF